MRGQLFLRMAWGFSCAVLVAGYAQAVEQTAPGPVLTFAAGYRIDPSNPHNIVELGVLTRCGAAWCLTVQRFDSASMLARVPTTHMHEMHAPYGAGACRNGAVHTIVPDQGENSKVKVVADPAGFTVSANKLRYRWLADPSARGGYSLEDIAPLAGGTKPDQAVGFAFTSEREMQGSLKRAQFAAHYKGEIYKKTAFTKAAGAWSFAPSTINPGLFAERENGAVLSLSQPGQATVVQKYGKQMWVQNTLVLAREQGTMVPLVQEYGHDFDMDGCFNEPGHNKLLLPAAGKGSAVQALVYIEYASDRLRGFPMLSVGRYYQ